MRVVVVDDHDLVRAGLTGVLGNDPSIEVVAEASNGAQALAAVEVHHPDVVVMDLQMPGIGGIEAARRILTARPGTAVLVLTMFNDDDSIFAAVRAGACGYLLKGVGRDELRAAVVGAAAGQAVFGAGVAARVLDRMVGHADPGGPFPELTPREVEVLGHLVDGVQLADIGRRMRVTDKTVRNNISSVLTKLHVGDRAEAIERGRRAGMGHGTRTSARTLVVTEIDAATALVRRLGDAYPAVLADHNRIVEAAINRLGGHCFRASGDAHFAWFAEPAAAIAAAISLHRDLAAHAFPTGTQVAVRVGIHRGTVSESGDELVGLALDETARVVAVAPGGGIVVTEEGRPNPLSDGVSLSDLGDHDLRDLDRPLHLYRVDFTL